MSHLLAVREYSTMERVTGIGGVFVRASDPEGNRVELWEPAPSGREDDLRA